MERIESPDNPLIKTLRRLARPRRGEPELLLEGTILVRTAIESQIPLGALVFSSSFVTSGKAERWLETVEVAPARVLELPDRLFESITHLSTPEGVLATARRPNHRLDAVGPNETLVVAIDIREPGNLGAIARIAEAAGAAALVVPRGSTDPFAPKAIRGSMGSLLRLPVLQFPSPERALEEIKDAGYRLVALMPLGGIPFRQAELSSPVAVVLGNEASGLSPELVVQCDASVSIPMQGQVESLNVAAAAALVLYQAMYPRADS